MEFKKMSHRKREITRCQTWKRFYFSIRTFSRIASETHPAEHAVNLSRKIPQISAKELLNWIMVFSFFLSRAFHHFDHIRSRKLIPTAPTPTRCQSHQLRGFFDEIFQLFEPEKKFFNLITIRLYFAGIKLQLQSPRAWPVSHNCFIWPFRSFRLLLRYLIYFWGLGRIPK